MSFGPFWSSAIVALVWMLPFCVGIRFHEVPSRARRAWLSVAGGTAIAYVFVDLLPEMQRMQEIFSLGAVNRGLPFPEYRVHGSALIGFVFFYALESMAAATRREGDAVEQDRPIVTWFHIGGFAVYCGLMAYLLREDADRGGWALPAYAVAMFCHFWIVDHALRREHGRPYDRVGRWLLAGGILAGWIVAALGASSDLVLPTLMGLIAGGVVMNSIKEELPEKGQAKVLPFVAGALGYALILILVS